MTCPDGVGRLGQALDRQTEASAGVLGAGPDGVDSTVDDADPPTEVGVVVDADSSSPEDEHPASAVNDTTAATATPIRTQPL
ncbi:hypothetical protein QSJ18_10130 [Gordonia sp. ABSL1-1]|uniref:hypothetical protein n=1 Tax=Gordonia sp. ABSL1-1 TaxID=3053923 RepID=UPI002573FF65|nr:hypothetical protein [Gordonia sp. ABSL1-1]MDL9937099.1 hypothetical protein [Gordonia sp. ABSL1-1]